MSKVPRAAWIMLAVIVVLGGGSLIAVQTGAAQSVLSMLDDDGPDYPTLDTSRLTAAQQRIVEVTHTEFDAQPPGTKYSDGVDESWCADFVSWVMHSSDVVYTNPNSGGWRIPGVATLTEYFQSRGDFRSADSGYRPKLGDVVLYAADSKFGQHTNIVLRDDDGVLTTVGGNEAGRIRIGSFAPATDAGLVGYGVL
ncbi:hypothetical protein nbrc107696_21100 [Gordonia spumicola]|uniref:Peptidase C51 domain-containing protein n=1 Tax=Gordonia spumicola TaxID=589161 RepID=A0A7I9V8U7_9ACTN|nr:CHAP domain-containing protein [Gordonia spumicola]GEE01664.1 hypothetical protein nbrc107696_21100 [Gordonia spumicola]